MVASYSLNRLTPVLLVDSVEAGLAFWSDQLGFTKENEVPGPDGKLIFGSAMKDGIEVMYQTKASVIAEDPAAAAELNGRSMVLFITVPSIADLDAIEAAVQGSPVVKARHETFYGATEFYVREPGGHTVGFAAFK